MLSKLEKEGGVYMHEFLFLSRGVGGERMVAVVIVVDHYDGWHCFSHYEFACLSLFVFACLFICIFIYCVIYFWYSST